MKQCKDCAYWDQRRGSTPRSGRCRKITHRDWSYLPEGVLACTSDHEGYLSSLTTRDDFGCVLFEERKP